MMARPILRPDPETNNLQTNNLIIPTQREQRPLQNTTLNANLPHLEDLQQPRAELQLPSKMNSLP